MHAIFALYDLLAQVTVTAMLLDTLADIRTRIGARITTIRERHGFKIDPFADHVGIHRNTLAAIEKGLQWPQYSNLVAIAEGLGEPLEAFFSDLEPPVLKPSPQEALEVLSEYVKATTKKAKKPSIPADVVTFFQVADADSIRQVESLIDILMAPASKGDKSGPSSSSKL